MTDQKKTPSGGNREGAGKIVNLNSYKQPTSTLTTRQAPFAEKIAEDAWLRAKREYLENPTPANFWASGILERAFFLMYRGGAA
jgi:hypothetical protein